MSWNTTPNSEQVHSTIEELENFLVFIDKKSQTSRETLTVTTKFLGHVQNHLSSYMKILRSGQINQKDAVFLQNQDNKGSGKNDDRY